MENVIPADTKLARNAEGKYFPVADDDPRAVMRLAYPLDLSKPQSPLVPMPSYKPTLAEFARDMESMLAVDAEWLRRHGYR